MVVMNDDVNESSEYLRSKHDFPTPRCGRRSKRFRGIERRSYRCCREQRFTEAWVVQFSLPLSPIRRSFIR